MADLNDIERKEKYLEMTSKATEMLENIHLPIRREKIRSDITEMVEKASVIIDITCGSGSEERPPGQMADIMALDSAFIAQAANVVKGCTEAVDVNPNTFVVSDFLQNIVKYIKDSEFYRQTGAYDWDKLNKAAASCGAWVPSVDYMLGTFEEGDVEPRKRGTGAGCRAKYAAVAKKPEIVEASDKLEDNVEESVQSILKQMTRAYRANDKQPLCYFTFITDPTSFGNTVENMFHTSFLVKDGHVRLKMDKNGLPTLEPILKKRREGTQESEVEDPSEAGQMIVSLNMKEYREVIKVFKIERAMISLPREDQPQPSTSRSSQSQPSTSKSNQSQPSTSRSDQSQPSTSKGSKQPQPSTSGR